MAQLLARYPIYNALTRSFDITSVFNEAIGEILTPDKIGNIIDIKNFLSLVFKEPDRIRRIIDKYDWYMRGDALNNYVSGKKISNDILILGIESDERNPDVERNSYADIIDYVNEYEGIHEIDRHISGHAPGRHADITFMPQQLLGMASYISLASGIRLLIGYRPRSINSKQINITRSKMMGIYYRKDMIVHKGMHEMCEKAYREHVQNGDVECTRMIASHCNCFYRCTEFPITKYIAIKINSNGKIERYISDNSEVFDF